jgi:hypothetical protein
MSFLNQQIKTSHAVLIILGVTIYGMYSCIASHGFSSSNSASNPNSSAHQNARDYSINTGDNVYLYLWGENKKLGGVLVASSEESLQKFLDALHAKDQIGYGDMMMTGSAWYLEPNTKALLLKDGDPFYNIRVMDDKSPYFGRSAWILPPCVHAIIGIE